MQDVAMFYIEESKKYIDRLVDIPLYDSIFEATEGNSNVVDMEKNNAINGKKAESLLSKAITVIKEIYNKIKESLKNMWQWLQLKPDEKEAYNAFVKKCKEDPEFANKKITVKDWKLIDGKYDQLINEIQSEIEKIKRSEEELKPSIKKSLEEKFRSLGTFANKATKTVVMEQLISRSRYNSEFAKEVEFMNDIGILDLLKKDLDPKDQKKYNKQIKRINSASWLVRLLAGVRKQKADIHEQIAFEEKKNMQQLGKSILKSSMKYGNAGVKAVASTGIEIAKQAAGDVRDDYKQVRYLKKQKKADDKANARAEKNAQKQAKRDAKRGVNYTNEDLIKEKNRLRKEKANKIKYGILDRVSPSYSKEVQMNDARSRALDDNNKLRK